MSLSTEEQEAIKQMSMLSARFYVAAQQTNVHAFIEFTGLMNEYIKICTRTPGFMHSNTHSETPLRMESFEAAYLAEKLDCIYGPTLRSSPELMKALLPEEPYGGESCPGPRCGGVISIAHGKCTHCNVNYPGALPDHPAYDELKKL